MPKQIDTPEARGLHESGVAFVEVLPAPSYAEQHIPGAINVPLAEMTPRSVEQLDPAKPLVVYCFDYQ